MTADIRTAAQREAEDRWPTGGQWNDREVSSARGRFMMGAVWAAARVTPTREQIADAIAGEEEYPHPRGYRDHADAVLALMKELAEGESSG